MEIKKSQEGLGVTVEGYRRGLAASAKLRLGITSSSGFFCATEKVKSKGSCKVFGELCGNQALGKGYSLQLCSHRS